MIAVREWFSGRVFRFVHGRNLVYNTCWEDPRLDRIALALRPSDRLVMITSAGCNALDYALQEPKRIDAVDVNPRQNALLELKIAALRNLEFEDFFALFGRGHLAGAEQVYTRALRGGLSPGAQRYWDRWIKFFADPRRSFYYRGTSGTFARMIIGVVDFYVSRKFPSPERRRHGWCTRTFWPAWFARDNVFLSADHLPFLQAHFQPVQVHEGRARLPYVPLLRVPFYTFIGRREDEKALTKPGQAPSPDCPPSANVPGASPGLVGASRQTAPTTTSPPSQRPP